MLGDSIARGELVPVLTEYSTRENDYSLYALYHPGHYQDPKVRSFIDFLVESIGETPTGIAGCNAPQRRNALLVAPLVEEVGNLINTLCADTGFGRHLLLRFADLFAIH